MQLLSRLMPRERQFFELFNQHAAFINQGSAALASLLQTYDDQANRARLINQIEEHEHSADRVTRETVALLHTTFITPLDRDDIHRLISRMDDILDLIQDTAESLMLYDIQKITPETVHLGDLVKLCCDRVLSAVALLSNMTNSPAILKICQEIDGLESDADRVMRAGISKLFRDESDVRQLIKLKAVYELLESATDKCQDVANVIEGVVLEHG
jgi:uncharacterized protein